ncbi:MAG: hypothetical protein F6J97_23155 [Leptolyngbya sp. SIO4C1]|nr:hypothetical protein [Leptolyngbya sp. SIO4C1]
MSDRKLLITVWCLYLVGSLIHFIHNAEFLKDYPNLPDSWMRNGIYLAWVGMTLLGAIGLILAIRSSKLIGLNCLVVYALLGIDSLGHYIVAPFDSHTAAMNTTILLEVGAAVLLLTVAGQQLYRAIARP